MEERGDESVTRVMIGVNQSNTKGYPHPSISSNSAFEWTLSKMIRSNTREFKVLFIHVQVPDEDRFDDVDSVYASPEDFKDMRRRDSVRGLHLLEFFVNKCTEFGVGCEAWMKKGDPKEVICSEAKRVHPDLLVVGCRGLGPFQRVFVGTVSEYCQKHAPCPVLCIKRCPHQTPQDPVED